jgi:ATP-binding cassette, subfamily B, multidrug efflux pump
MQKKGGFDFRLLTRILRLAIPYRKVFIFAAVLAIILAPLSSFRPLLIQKMVDEHIFKHDVPGMTNMLFLLIGVLILEVIIMYIFNYTTSWLGQSVIKDLRVNVFRHVSNQRLTYFDKTPIGQTTTRTISDIETINSVFSEGIITIIADLLTLIVVFSVMFYTNWKLTLICMTVLPLLLIAAYFFKEEVKKSFQVVRTQVATMNTFLQEHISGMRIIQIFNAEIQEAEKFKVINRKYTHANLKAITAYAVFFPVVEILSAAALGLMVWYGTKGVISNQITLGVLIAFPVYISMLFRPIRMLADKFNTLQMGMVAAERVFVLLDDNKYKELNGKNQIENIKGNLKFENVSFAYNDEEYVLKNINFELKPNETLAIVGYTGSGKSTIASLINKLYPIDKGKISVDGIDINTLENESYRKKIAVVLQDVFLFSGSVLENITLRDKNITKEKVLQAAKNIGAHEFIEKLPGGYDYQVMERGATLSMGQRQLISFVRALVFEPDLLILDEATSSIDPESEGIIKFAIERLIEKCTSIIIAHRLSTIRHADKIMVLDKGEVKEYGTHEELLSINNGHFKQLYDNQVSALELIR